KAKVKGPGPEPQLTKGPDPWDRTERQDFVLLRSEQLSFSRFGEGGLPRGDRTLHSLSTCNSLVTEKTPGTLLAWTSAICLSIGRATAPVRVTWPLFTMMWMGGTARNAYWLRTSLP